MSAVGRVLLLGCALLAALLPGGCGGGDSTGEATIASDAPVTTTVEASKLRQLEQQPKRHHVPADNLCQSQLGSFVGSLDGLRRRLAVGVTYDQYVAEVRGIRSTYGKIPIGELRVDCLSLVATPAEKTFNRYIEGANEWGECVSEVGCGTTEIEPVLQRRWRVASHFLSEAQDGLQAIA